MSKLKEWDNSKKLEQYFRKNSFELAYRVAKNNKYDDSL